MNKNRRTAPMWAKSLARKFEIEKNAKNKAYYFILSHGYYYEFREFYRKYQSGNPHKDCLGVLQIVANKKQCRKLNELL